MSCMKAVNESNSQRRQVDPQSHILLIISFGLLLSMKWTSLQTSNGCAILPQNISEDFLNSLEISASRIKPLIQITTYWMDLPHSLERAETQQYDKRWHPCTWDVMQALGSCLWKSREFVKKAENERNSNSSIKKEKTVRP